jgi:hypothetical protein
MVVYHSGKVIRDLYDSIQAVNVCFLKLGYSIKNLHFKALDNTSYKYNYVRIRHVLYVISYSITFHTNLENKL